MSIATTHTDTQKQLVPAIRFKEFDEGWSKKDFGSIVNKSKTKFDPQKSKIEFPCIEMESISKESSLLLEVFNSKDQKSIKGKFEKGDVLFGKLRPNLKKYMLAPFDGVCSSEIWVLKGKELSNDFLFRLVQTNKFYSVALTTSGSKMPRADWAYISSFPFSYPTLPEQQKIASFLSGVDEKIQQLTKKKELLEQYKKGVMQQLFSGQLRFKDEEGNDYPEWEEKRLGKMTSLLKDGTHGTHKDLPGGEHYLLSAKNINNGQIIITDNERLISKSEYNSIYKNYILKENDILLTIVGTIGRVAKFRKEVNIAFQSSVAFFRFESDVSDYILQYMYSIAFQRELNKRKVISAQPGIYLGDLSKILIPRPCLEEQQKIATYLSSIDTKLERVSGQITQTQTFKKGLLQQMFV